MPSPAPLLEMLERAERRGDLPACAAAMRSLASTLRDSTQGPVLQAALTDWLLNDLGLVTPPALGSAEAAAWREAVWDSAVDLTSDASGLAIFLELTAERLEALRNGARPNLLSMLRARAHWRARDRMRQVQVARARTAQATAELHPTTSFDSQARLVAALAVQRIARRFEDEPHLVGMLERLLRGETLSEISEATGLSRPTLYRGLARVRAWLTETPRESEAGAPGLRRMGGSHV